MTRKKSESSCGFCGRPQSKVGILLEGKFPNHYICESCTRTSMQIIEQEKLKVKPKILKNLKPKEIVEKLDQFVVGQYKTKKTLAVAVHNHYKRIHSSNIQKSNILMIGKTSSGKTLLAKTIAKIINIPFAIGDATTLTETGYVGEDVESLLFKLLSAADFDVSLAEIGIVYIDEIDKISRSASNTRDISGEGVQQGLLKILEGTVSNVPPQNKKEPKHIQLDTTNILFICGGTFVGLEEIISRRSGSTMGFLQKESKVDLESITTEDLVEFGLIPELIGRLPIISILEDITDQQMIRILTEPKDAIIKQYQALFEMEGCTLKFTESALSEIVKINKKDQIGARGLRRVLESFMLDIMYELPDQPKQEYIITDKIVRGEDDLFGF